MSTCDLYDVPTQTTTSGIDHSLDGLRNVSHTGTDVYQVKLYLYRTGTINNNIITLKTYEDTSLISTRNNTTDITYNGLTTDSSNPTEVTWDIIGGYTLTADTRLVIVGDANCRSGANSSTPTTWVLTLSTTDGATWVDAGSNGYLRGCISTAAVVVHPTLLPPPPAYVRL